MTDKDELTTDNPTEESEQSSQTMQTDDLDVEGALAALSSLNDLTQERAGTDDINQDDDLVAYDDDVAEPDAMIQTFERVDSGDDGRAMQEAPSYETAFPRPPISVLHRGQLASVVPALLLIGIGGYLTFMVTTSDEALAPPVVASILVGGLGAMFLAQWISSSRWSIGSFFLGVLLLLTGGTVAYLILPTQLSLLEGYPLIATAIGTAFVITDLFVPSGRRIWLIGLILAISGLAGLVATASLVNLSALRSLTGLLPVVLIICAVVILAPLVGRRQ